ncbi:MAG: iron-sulfur cluster assembly scaffold protein [Syntrophobacteraceae bacterium]
MDEKIVDFFREHSNNFLEMALQTGKLERIMHPDGYGMFKRECGDSLEIFLSARNGSIQTASFYTEGCIYTVACANTLVRMIEGKSTEYAWTVTPRHLADYLETLPEKEHHCAELAIKALRLALLNLKETERQPWVKFYRNNS